jgi:PBSX family phage terminase large subunit
MLSPKQVDCLIHSDYDLNIASGSIRSGKTYAFNARFVEDLENDCIPAVDCLITGKKLTAAYRNVIKPMLQHINEEGLSDRFEYKRNPDRLIYLPKNIDCYVDGANDVSSEERIRGMTIQRWYGDEVTTYPENFVMQAIGRCSAGNRYKYLTCNPDSPKHYFKTNFIDKIESGKINGKVWYFDIEHDNPVLSPEYIEQLKNLYTGVFFDRFIRGLWVAAEGGIYNELDRSVHVISDLPEMREYFLAVDWGYENPLAILLIGIDHDNRYYVVDEFYKRQQLVDDSLKNQLIAKFGPYGYEFNTEAYCDTNRPEQMRQLSDLFDGLNVVGAVKEVIDGIQEVQRHFKQRGDGTYGLYFHSRCVNTITEHENYRWKQVRSGVQKGDEPLKENDHTCDGVRYLIYTRRKNFSFDNAPDSESKLLETPIVSGVSRRSIR